MMNFDKTEEQQLLLESLNEILNRVATDAYLKECDQKKMRPQKVADALRENGFMSLGVPEEYGGTPCDLLTLMMVSEEMNRHGLTIGMFSHSLQLHNVLKCGNKKQIEQTVDIIMNRGENAYCLGFSEPGAGSDSSSLTTTYTRKNGKVYINGNKTFITGAKESKYMLCMARNADTSDPDKTFSMWWLPMNAKGIKLEEIHKIGWRMRSNCDVYLENVELDEEDIFGEEGKGFVQLMDNFEVERILICANITGMAQGAFEDAARYANQRVQFGKKIGSFQLIQEKITQMAIKVENMRNMVYKCALNKEKGRSQQIEAAMCKYYCARSGNEVIDDAVQILGGIGITEDSRLSRFWRDARIHRIGGGTDEIMIHIAGRGLLKRYNKH